MGSFFNLSDRSGVTLSPTLLLILLFAYLLYKTYPVINKFNNKLDEIEQLKSGYEVIKANLNALTAKIDGIDSKMQDLQKSSDESEKAKAQQLLVGMYHKYVPLGKWTRLESDTFWRIFRDYERRGGNGYMHSVIQPAMESLEITEEY